MLRKMKDDDITMVMDIWLNVNRTAHSFIPMTYWQEHSQMVFHAISSADVYVYETAGTIKGFIGLQDTYIAGIFVQEMMQNKGIGKQLLDEVKKKRTLLQLHVYEKNEKAIHFYKREGFSILAREFEEETKAYAYLLEWRA